MFDDRLARVRKEIKNKKIDAVLISSVSNITYLTGFSNFSGREREAYLIITKDEQYIITDARYSEAIKREVPHFKLLERSPKTPTEKLFKDLKKKIQFLGIEEDELTVAEHKLLTKHFRKMKHVEIEKNRAIKTAEEIKKIEQAAKLGDQAFDYILKKIKLGISEKQLAFELEYFIAKQQARLIKKNGAEVSFPPIVAFGKNSSVPHHQTGKTVLAVGQIVLLDFGVKLNDYCSDMTRTVFFGKPSDRQKKIYKTVLEAQQKAVDFVNSRINRGTISLRERKTGKKLMAAEVDKVARDYIVSQGYPTIPHSLGHGIGLEVHEHPSLSPTSKDHLKEGMVFSIEPGIYLPNFGGVRIEDLFVLEKEQLKQLSHSSKQIIATGI